MQNARKGYDGHRALPMHMETQLNRLQVSCQDQQRGH